MSKRGTSEDHVSKEQYDHVGDNDDGEDAAVFAFTSPAIFAQSATQASSPALSSSITVKPMGSSREEYERAMEALNTAFVRKVTKEVERNPIANLAQVFGQYVDKRTKVKARFNEGTGASAAKMAKKDPLSTPSGGQPTFGSISSSSSNNSSNGSISTSSPAPSASSFSFTAPASKEGDTAPKPAFSGFNFGVKTDSTSAPTITTSVTTPTTTTTTTTSAPLFSSFGGFGANAGATTATTTAGSSTFSFGAPATSVATTTSAPFSFNAAKPFSFNPPTPTTPSTTSALGLNASSSAAAAPTSFAFQVPAQFAQGGAGNAAAAGEDDKMPDDTKSNLVDNREGEEGESTVFEVRAKLYAFEGSEHKDLGVGQFRVNEVETTKKRRMIMRNGTGMLTLNSWIIQGMAAKRDKSTVTVFAIADGKPKRFALRVKTEDSAKELEAALAAGQDGDSEEKKGGGEDK
ncbi:hypothetical protein DFQ27_005114 [Actinomortierella ambigua]|uniref:RanBD1 domain-containing protein n=1 Tax=Actinomortierella ambigua TaxID=1343610 RepID=A0A9P6QM64_9FUNG|nr:hypothetical protein DFQ27_005114 [Actinomortierella ambigua]